MNVASDEAGQTGQLYRLGQTGIFFWPTFCYTNHVCLLGKDNLIPRPLQSKGKVREEETKLNSQLYTEAKMAGVWVHTDGSYFIPLPLLHFACTNPYEMQLFCPFRMNDALKEAFPAIEASKFTSMTSDAKLPVINQKIKCKI